MLYNSFDFPVVSSYIDVPVRGGAGFISGHLAENFTTDGRFVVVVDNFEPYYDLGIKEHNVEAGREAAKSCSGNCELVSGSTTDAELVEDLVSDTDVVYHQIAQAGV